MATVGLLAKKMGMTQIFDESGRQVPVTVLEAGPCYVTDVRTAEKNGYAAVQIAYNATKEKHLSRAELGHLAKTKTPPMKLVREIRTDDVEGLKPGARLTVENFEVGDFVDVIATSIGRGFQGVVKRHHFKGDASKSHGSMFGRVPGSIGASSFPSRVVKGMKAAGHMGNGRVTVQNLKVVKIDAENNLLVLRGSVPGAEESFLLVRTATKRPPKTPRQWKAQGGAEEKPAKEAASEKASQ